MGSLYFVRKTKNGRGLSDQGFEHRELRKEPQEVCKLRWGVNYESKKKCRSFKLQLGNQGHEVSSYHHFYETKGEFWFLHNTYPEEIVAANDS